MSEQPSDAVQSSRPDLLDISFSERDGATIVHLAGDIDMATVGMAAAALADTVSRATTIVVDMTDIRFFASAGLNMLLKLHKELENGEVTVLVAGDPRTVLRPLELMGLTDLFPIHATVEDALGSAGS